MESTEIADSLKEAKELDLDRRIAIYIAFLAVLLSICSVGGGNATRTSPARTFRPPIPGPSTKPNTCGRPLISSPPMDCN